METHRDYLVGGWTNPSEKYYCSQIGNLPQIGVNIKNIWNHQLATVCCINGETHLNVKYTIGEKHMPIDFVFTLNTIELFTSLLAVSFNKGQRNKTLCNKKPSALSNKAGEFGSGLLKRDSPQQCLLCKGSWNMSFCAEANHAVCRHSSGHPTFCLRICLHLKQFAHNEMIV